MTKRLIAANEPGVVIPTKVGIQENKCWSSSLNLLT